MSLMMDDNLAGSGATITEVASVSASCAVHGFGLSLPPPRTPAHRPKARAWDGDPSRVAPLLTLHLALAFALLSFSLLAGGNCDGGMVEKEGSSSEEREEEILHVHEGAWTRHDRDGAFSPLNPSTTLRADKSRNFLSPLLHHTTLRGSWVTITLSTSPLPTAR